MQISIQQIFDHCQPIVLSLRLQKVGIFEI